MCFSPTCFYKIREVKNIHGVDLFQVKCFLFFYFNPIFPHLFHPKNGSPWRLRGLGFGAGGFRRVVSSVWTEGRSLASQLAPWVDEAGYLFEGHKKIHKYKKKIHIYIYYIIYVYNVFCNSETFLSYIQ